MNLLLAATDASGKLHALQTQFGIEGKYLLMQVISFSILAFVLYRFFFKPVLASVDERNRQIQQGLHHAEEMKAKLAAAQAESAAIIKQSQVEASRIIDDARKSAKDFLDRQTKEATEKAADLIAKGQQAIQLEHRKMLADARSEIARLVVTTTQQVLAKELSAEERSRYTSAATRELTSV
ncbi:MAG TPA: F0F1 ATP synthase subunit B [Candidatus Synoicihabitans sp.]|nr:F0F1 ATP synthase subunit B [Candidatus Synoicihabitans sp.]